MSRTTVDLSHRNLVCERVIAVIFQNLLEIGCTCWLGLWEISIHMVLHECEMFMLLGSLFLYSPCVWGKMFVLGHVEESNLEGERLRNDAGKWCDIACSPHCVKMFPLMTSRVKIPIFLLSIIFHLVLYVAILHFYRSLQLYMGLICLLVQTYE